MHHTMESSDPNTAVRITPQSQTAHLGVWIENFTSLWLLLKGPSGEILLGVNTSIMKEKIWSIKSGFTQPKFFTPQCHAHRGVEFFKLCNWISRRNRNRIRKYFTLFIRGPDGFESWKKWQSKISWTLPLKYWEILTYCCCVTWHKSHFKKFLTLHFLTSWFFAVASMALWRVNATRDTGTQLCDQQCAKGIPYC